LLLSFLFGVIHMIKKYLKDTKLWCIIRTYLRISLRLRFLNWFVQKFIYRTPDLKFSLHFASRVVHADKLILGKSAQNSLSRKGGCYIGCFNGVEIGEGTVIAAGVKIISANHKFDDFNKYEETRPIRIGRHCWLSVNAVILPGVELGDNVIVGAGAVVSKSFPSNCVLAGVPAKIINYLQGPAEQKV
jgi:acetyltransferase-like isoleucine patch superfamily enzyme